MPGNTIYIGFAGFCKTDIMLYLSRILQCLGETVAIVDRSHSQDLRYSVPTGIYSEDRMDYRGVEIFLGCENTPVSELPLTDMSAVIIDFGVNAAAIDDMVSLKALFIVTDLQRAHTVPLSAFLGRIQSRPDSIRIIRDIVPGKIRPRYVDSLLQSGQVTNLIAKYEFDFSGAEYAARLTSQYDDIFQFSKIPEEYKNMLLECITELFGKDGKLCLKALKKAQRGG